MTYTRKLYGLYVSTQETQPGSESSATCLVRVGEELFVLDVNFTWV